jgi:hypothetical protein
MKKMIALLLISTSLVAQEMPAQPMQETQEIVDTIQVDFWHMTVYQTMCMVMVCNHMLNEVIEHSSDTTSYAVMLQSLRNIIEQCHGLEKDAPAPQEALTDLWYVFLALEQLQASPTNTECPATQLAEELPTQN